MRLFRPRYYVRHFEKMDIDRLKKAGIKVLLCDIDNTLVGHDDPKPDQSVVDFIDKVKESGIQVVLCSNSKKKRATRFSKDLHVDKTYYYSMKPLGHNFIRASRYYKVKMKEMALIGDQMYTDMLGGNLWGLYTILTAPIKDYDLGITQFNRKMEAIPYFFLKLQGFKKGDFDD